MDNDNLEEPLKMPESGGLDYSRLSPPEPMGGRAVPVAGPANLVRQPAGPATPSPAAPSPTPAAPSSPPPPPPPASAGQQPQPLEDQEPRNPLVSLILMIFLSLILVLGVLVFVSWKGWLSLGGLEKLWGGGKTSPSPTAAISAKPSSVVSISPEASTSPGETTNANDQRRKADLAKIKEALTKYFADNDQFPLAITGVKTADQTTVLYQALVPKYLEKLPDDPLAPQYYYGYKSDGQTFELTCVLEDKTDPEGTLIGQLYIYKLTGSSGT